MIIHSKIIAHSPQWYAHIIMWFCCYSIWWTFISMRIGWVRLNRIEGNMEKIGDYCERIAEGRNRFQCHQHHAKTRYWHGVTHTHTHAHNPICPIQINNLFDIAIETKLIAFFWLLLDNQKRKISNLFGNLHIHNILSLSIDYFDEKLMISYVYCIFQYRQELL